MVCVGVCVLLCVSLRYTDPVQQNLQLLQQLREMQMGLQEALQHAGEFGADTRTHTHFALTTAAPCGRCTNCSSVCVCSQSGPAAAEEEEEGGEGRGRTRRGARSEHPLPASCDITSYRQLGGRHQPAVQLGPQCLSQPRPTLTAHILLLLLLLSSDLQHPGGRQAGTSHLARPHKIVC